LVVAGYAAAAEGVTTDPAAVL
jgi:hypothetical protein